MDRHLILPLRPVSVTSCEERHHEGRGNGGGRRDAGGALGAGARLSATWGVVGGASGPGTCAGKEGRSRLRKLRRAKKAAPTYTKDVAPILQAKCQNCHRRHQVGPFALETYEQARKRSHDIASVTEERSMPPWKPTPGVGPKLKHDQSLTHAEIDILTAWAEAGAPQGDPKDMPPPPRYAEGWKLGPPDLILEPGEGFPIAASGPDVYRCFVLPTNLARDRYLEAVDYAPGERAAVHHLIAYIDTTGQGRQLDADAPGPGYWAPLGPGFDADELSFWTAGSEPHRLPDGIGIHIPAQSDIILQIHYHPTGKAGNDKTRVGLYFAQAGQAGAALEQRVELQTSDCRPATTTSRSRRAGSSRWTWKPWPSPPTCTSSAMTCICRFACPTAAPRT